MKSDTTLCRSELAYWLALSYTPSIGPKRFFDLLNRFPQLSELFSNSATQLAALGLSPQAIASITAPPWDLIEANLDWSEKPGNHILACTDPNYPRLLTESSGAPALLFVQGAIEILNSAQLAMVGSRKPSATGLETAQDFAYQLSLQGLTITSGLALGIDTAAHKGALLGQGRTIAVMGCGLKQIYPSQNQPLAQAILNAQGALISEFPIEVRPQAENFPRRNRIVSGMSLGVLVVEATVRSGSLITARLGNEQGREVFAIPGSIHNPLSGGCHQLIAQGAKLVQTVQDILEELHSFHPSPTGIAGGAALSKGLHAKNFLDADCLQLLQCIGFETTTIDQLSFRSGFPTHKVASLLAVLEIKGRIVAVPGGYMKRKDE